MSAPRFHVPGLVAAAGDEVELPEAVAHHATRVLRLAERDEVTLFSGEGGEYAGTLARIDKRGARVRINAYDVVERESPLGLTLVLAVIATDPMDFAVRKAVELGVAAIAPVVAARSQGAAGGEKADKRLAHWRQIAVAACEQCGRNRIPDVAAPVPLAEWLAQRERGVVAALLVPQAERTLAQLAQAKPVRQLLIGPEGGFTGDEVARALAQGVLAAGLGPRVLRAETAAIAALATLNAVAGDGG